MIGKKGNQKEKEKAQAKAPVKKKIKTGLVLTIFFISLAIIFASLSIKSPAEEMNRRVSQPIASCKSF